MCSSICWGWKEASSGWKEGGDKDRKRTHAVSSCTHASCLASLLPVNFDNWVLPWKKNVKKSTQKCTRFTCGDCENKSDKISLNDWLTNWMQEMLQHFKKIGSPSLQNLLGHSTPRIFWVPKNFLGHPASSIFWVSRKSKSANFQILLGHLQNFLVRPTSRICRSSSLENGWPHSNRTGFRVVIGISNFMGIRRTFGGYSGDININQHQLLGQSELTGNELDKLELSTFWGQFLCQQNSDKLVLLRVLPGDWWDWRKKREQLWNVRWQN